MHMRYYAAAAAAATVALTVATPMAAQAATGKEMKVCWTAPAGSSAYSIHVDVDGPSSRSGWVKSGHCKSWNVKPGDYRVIWSNLDDIKTRFENAYENSNTEDEFFASTTAICGTQPQSSYWRRVEGGKATVKRFSNTLEYNLRRTDTVVTETLKDRQTKVNFRLNCQVANID